MANWSQGSGAQPPPRDWECPPAGAADDKILGWCREAVQQGRNFHRAQPSYQAVQDFMEIIAGIERIDPNQSDKLSGVKYNKSKRVVKELVAGLANLRPISSYRTENPDYQHQSEILNKLYLSWYHMSGANRAIRSAMQYAAGGKGWLSPIYVPSVAWSKQGDIKLYTYGPNSVLPVQIGEDNNIQEAYAVILCVETPLYQVQRKYPQFADKIRQDRSYASWLSQGVRAAQRFLSPALNAVDRQKQRSSAIGNFPTVDIYYTYILDASINDTGHMIPMGRPGSSWYYEVPSIGDDIATGMKDPQTGGDLTRKATAADARLYPLRRLLITTEDCVVNPSIADQTNIFWHGNVPLIPFQLDDWPWAFWGFPITQDTKPLEKSLVNTLRAIDDSANVSLDPPLKYGGTIEKSFMERFDARVPGQHMKIEGLGMGESKIEPILGRDYYSVPQSMPEHIRWLDNAIDYVSAVKDIQALLKAKQIPSSESIEKLHELMGPVLADMGQNVEASMQELGGQMKSNFFQFYPLARRMQILGPTGSDEQDWDYDPATLVPSHMPGEAGFEQWTDYARKNNFSHPPNIEAGRESNFSFIYRARWHMNNFTFRVVPNSLLQMTQITRKLALLQMFRTGFPIDPGTVADAWDIGNFGFEKQFPHVDTIIERWMEWERAKARLKVIIQEEAGIQPGAQTGPRGGPSGTGGRAPTGRVPPMIVQKDQGSRTTIKESR